jgi:hypothetical protein
MGAFIIVTTTVFVVVQSSAGKPGWVLIPLVLPAIGLVALALRARVELNDHEVVVVNPLRTTAIKRGEIISVSLENNPRWPGLIGTIATRKGDRAPIWIAQARGSGAGWRARGANRVLVALRQDLGLP